MVLAQSPKLTGADRIKGDVGLVAFQALRQAQSTLRGLASLMDKYGTDDMRAALGDEDWLAVLALIAKSRELVVTISGEAPPDPLEVAPKISMAARREAAVKAQMTKGKPTPVESCGASAPQA